MVLIKNLKFLHPFFLAKKDLEKVFFAVLDRKQAILDYRTSIFNGRKVLFFQSPKMDIFSNCLV